MALSYLTDEKKRILKQLRENLEDVLKPQHDDRFLLRWLRARNFNLEAAEAMLRSDFKFREKYGSDTILEDFNVRQEIKPYEWSNFLGFSKYGHSIRIFNVGNSDIRGLARALTLVESEKYLVYCVEADLKRLAENNKKNGTKVETLIFIVDIENIAFRDYIDKKVTKLMRRLIKVFQDHYPEILHSINFMNGENREAIFKLIPKDIFPAHLGGTRYGPGGDPKCSDILKWARKIPVSLYYSNFLALKADDPGVRRKTIRSRSLFEIPMEVNKAGMILCWEFQTKDYDIRFGVRFRKDSENSTRRTADENLMPVENVESHEVPEKGELLCKNAGIYTLIFDNTYSWFVSKQLLYRVEVKRPTLDEENSAD